MTVMMPPISKQLVAVVSFPFSCQGHESESRRECHVQRHCDDRGAADIVGLPDMSGGICDGARLLRQPRHDVRQSRSDVEYYRCQSQDRFAHYRGAGCSKGQDECEKMKK